MQRNENFGNMYMHAFIQRHTHTFFQQLLGIYITSILIRIFTPLSTFVNSIFYNISESKQMNKTLKTFLEQHYFVEI